MAAKRRNTVRTQPMPAAAKDRKPAAAKERTPKGVELRLAPGASMYVDIGNCQDQGARPYQEDAFGLSNIINSETVSRKGILAILSDGMGGLSNGKAVAEYVVQSAITLFEQFDPRSPIKPQIETIIEHMNRAVCDRYADGGVSTAGATIVFVYIYKNRIYWAAVGDSRLYCIRNGGMFRMNEDHDYLNSLYRMYLNGEMTLEDAVSDPQKDSLVSFIGKEDMPYIDSSIRGFRIRPGDAFVICSDGIYNAITEEAMMEFIKDSDAQTASEKIVQNVREARFPGQDNMTVMVIKCQRA